MKRLVYILTCFLTLVFFAKAESKPKSIIHFDQYQFQSKDLSISQNDLSIALIDANDDFYVENNDEADFGKNGFDQYAFLNFGEVIFSNLNYHSFKPVVYGQDFAPFLHTPTIPLYILFHSMIIPFSN
ncbi:hypothetical protein [Flavobacterium sp. 245]|uniref:hypothetical protein n=1 Tax=Flavobacterium sp. 245 TaxID=2512115 RepID=UPI001061F63E|nr:hypothetical protein [Flavobacterium sp. 245]TDO94921.1 hypothetical protein EV145_1156 [Flavobacterium sp. 245]